jgi:zinc-binding alcohol dehydrogenase family protein
MKAVALTRYADIDHPESVFDLELPDPAPPGGYDLLVRVMAVSVNQLDNRVRRPKDKVEPVPRVIGFDAAGVVLAVGPLVHNFRPGDRVFYSGDPARPGSHAEQQLVDARLVGRMPASASFDDAAAMPLAGLTAYEMLFDRMRVQAGRSILIIGAAGGVGSMAVQLAVKVAGLTLIGTASRPESKDWVQRMGAHMVINHHADIPSQLAALGMPEVDYVMVLADTDRNFEVAAKVVAPQGTIGLAVEATVPANIGLLWDKSVTLVWEMVYTRVDHGTADMARQSDILNELAQLSDQGTLVNTVTERLEPINAANLRAAHRRMATGAVIGKLTLRNF